MDNERFPMSTMVADLVEWKVYNGPVARVEREGMYNKWFSINSIHCTP